MATTKSEPTRAVKITPVAEAQVTSVRLEDLYNL
jgi:hypothetical protein